MIYSIQMLVVVRSVCNEFLDRVKHHYHSHNVARALNVIKNVHTEGEVHISHIVSYSNSEENC